MGPNRRAQERERAAARAAAEAKRAEAERKTIAEPKETSHARRAVNSARLTCARSTDTQAARSQGSFRHCRVGGARQTLRLHGSKC